MTKIVILTGAGISAESGLSTFRDKGGIWSQVSLEDVATPEGFARNPDMVHGFYNARRGNLAAVQPNAAHAALARLAEAPGIQCTLVTQNVDNLHERGGSPEVVHMHGELSRALCAACGHRWYAPAEMSVDTPCPSCGRPSARPDVVWFGEMPYHLDRIGRAIDDCDNFAAIGTSGQVYPAAGFVTDAAMAGAHTVEINLEATDVSGVFAEHVLGPATEAVPRWVEQVLTR